MNDKEMKEERFEVKGDGVKVENKPASNWDSVLKKYDTKEK